MISAGPRNVNVISAGKGLKSPLLTPSIMHGTIAIKTISRITNNIFFISLFSNVSLHRRDDRSVLCKADVVYSFMC